MKNIICILLTIAMLIVFSGCGGEPVPPETRDVKGLKLTDSIKSDNKGTFIFGFGTYRSEEELETKYYMYIKGVEGFRLQSIDSDNLEIVETNDIRPCIKGYFSDNGSVGAFSDYIVYVPEGTIYEEYSADVAEINN